MDFKSALTKVCHDFSKEIIFQRRIISILDDYVAFKDVPYYKLFYKTILNIGDMTQLISQNPNERDKAIYTFLAISGLDEAKVNSFLTLVSECYYGKQSPAGKSDSINVNNERKQERIEQQLENTQNENISSSHSKYKDNVQSSILFMGIPLGIDFNLFADKLIAKGFQRHDYANEIRFSGKFLSFDYSSVQLFKTPISHILYRADVIISPNPHTSVNIFKIVTELYVKRYGNFFSKQDGLDKSVRLFMIGDDEIRLIKSNNDSIRIEYIANIAQQLYKRESKLNKATIKNDERDAIRKKMQQNIDDI